MTEIVAQDDTVTLNKTTTHFQLLPMSKVDSPYYAFMRCRLSHIILLDFSLTLKAAPHAWVIGTGQP